jgi:3-isopropylmalate/(R)-2-methylmalate dehydratase small subunit
MANTLLIQSQTFNLPVENVDTDQIYPARYLTTTTQTGLGQYCFRDWRTNKESSFYHLFQNHDSGRQRVLVSGANFGCGSSREHAAWSLLDAGFQAVISSSFGDIFHSNAQKNGLVLVEVNDSTLEFLMEHDGVSLSIDISTATAEIEGLGSISFPMDEFAAYCLLNGIDSLDYLLGKLEEITGFEQEHMASPSS